MAEPFWVEIVSADALVWEGESTQLTATTTEGMIGVLAHHIPLIATLAPGSTAEVTATDGTRHVVAVDGGFVSVTLTRTAIISPYAQMAEDIDIDQARRDLRECQDKRDAGDNSMETEMAYRRAQAQVKAVDH
ncbi:MAG: F0F1 ATP synthase subunit epsilon [Propionibacteriaceae bacterium]|jgi:F-type H+-transporting ATPase subunit epsilon|nr:F0F1 ATP synthase subunit epsilon [Propionibacteriaceae bacterium]